MVFNRYKISSTYVVCQFQNAYTATAINSTNFCTSARDAFLILVENALRVATINTVGDFVLFMGKVLYRSHVLILLYCQLKQFWKFPCEILQTKKNIF